jgi:VanZ family protein
MPLTFTKLALYWVPVLTWMGLIFAASGSPDLAPTAIGGNLELSLLPDPHVFASGEFRYHTGAFAVLALLLYPLLSAHVARPIHRLCLAVLLLAAAYAVADELHQAFVPGRTASVLDVGYDLLGVLLVLLSFRALGSLRTALRGKLSLPSVVRTLASLRL